MLSRLYARPYVSPITGAASIIIMESSSEPGAKDQSIDSKAIDGHGTFADEHHIPMNVMSEMFKKRFSNGGRYRQVTQWDYPYRGMDQIGCRVERVE